MLLGADELPVIGCLVSVGCGNRFKSFSIITNYGIGIGNKTSSINNNNNSDWMRIKNRSIVNSRENRVHFSSIFLLLSNNVMYTCESFQRNKNRPGTTITCIY